MTLEEHNKSKTQIAEMAARFSASHTASRSPDVPMKERILLLKASNEEFRMLVQSVLTHAARSFV